MNIISKTKLNEIIFDALSNDFDLDEDAVYDLMSAVKSLVDHVEVHEGPTSQYTKSILMLALAFGQSRVGGSRVDYAVNDILHAFNNHINITKISHDYLQSLSAAIQKQAINPNRELDTVKLLIQIMPDL